MPLLDDGLAAVAVILPECESFVGRGGGYRVLQELRESSARELQKHYTHAADH